MAPDSSQSRKQYLQARQQFGLQKGVQKTHCGNLKLTHSSIGMINNRLGLLAPQGRLQEIRHGCKFLRQRMECPTDAKLGQSSNTDLHHTTFCHRTIAGVRNTQTFTTQLSATAPLLGFGTHRPSPHNLLPPYHCWGSGQTDLQHTTFCPCTIAGVRNTQTFTTQPSATAPLLRFGTHRPSPHNLLPLYHCWGSEHTDRVGDLEADNSGTQHFLPSSYLSGPIDTPSYLDVVASHTWWQKMQLACKTIVGHDHTFWKCFSACTLLK